MIRFAMKILIIEDEQNNANRLVRLLHEMGYTQPSSEVMPVLTSNAEVKTFFQQGNATPDVILSDIQLGDGLSFESLRTVPSAIPIIFTTAYDEYAIQAFKFVATKFRPSRDGWIHNLKRQNT